MNLSFTCDDDSMGAYFRYLCAFLSYGLVQVLAPSSRVVEDRMIALEAFLRDCVALLGVYACSDSRAGQALQTLQTFLRVPQHVDAVDPDLIMEQVIYHQGED